MQLSNRALYLMLIAVLPIALYNLSPNLLYVGCGYLLLLVSVGTLDYLTSPLFKRIDLSRGIDSKFSLGAENAVTIRVTNNSPYRLRLRLKDDFPTKFQFNQDDLIELRSNAGVETLTPGVTGWAQINGRDELPIPEKVKLDVEYLQRQSFWFDLRIIILTLVRVLHRQGVSH